MSGLANIQLIGGVLTGVVTLVPPPSGLLPPSASNSTHLRSYSSSFHFGCSGDVTYVCSVLQCVAIGIAILCDRRTQPLLPKWFAWCTFLTAACYVPLSLMPFFRTGPVAWNGIVSFWVVFLGCGFTALATSVLARAQAS